MSSNLECILCESLFSEEDIYNYLFFSISRICYKCYKKLYKAATSISCFGKQFDSMAVECRMLCPDRKVCPLFFTKKIFKLRRKAESKTDLVQIKTESITTRKYPFRSNSIIGRAFKMAVRGIHKGKLKKWAERHSTSYYRIVAILKKQTKYGKKWKFQDDGERIKLGYSI